QQGVHVEAAAVKADRVVGGHAGLPVEALDVVGDRTDHVGRAVPQLNPAVAVEIDGESDAAGRHELRHAHGAGVAAYGVKRVASEPALQGQKLFNLALEILAALLGTRMAGREVKRQRGQRVHHAEAAGVAAIN